MVDGVNKPRIVIFKKIVEGDILKINKQSNESDSGGGARDFRFPLYQFQDVFKKMFPSKIGDGVYKAVFKWMGRPDTTSEIHIHPDQVRKEVRIAKVGDCFRYLLFEIGDVFLLVMDDEGRVWPYVVKLEDIKNPAFEPLLAQLILGCYYKNGKSSPAGYIDYESNVKRTTYEERRMSDTAIKVLKGLLAKKNVILTGPPASGKSTLMNEVAKLFCGNQNPCPQPFHDPTNPTIPIQKTKETEKGPGDLFPPNRKVFRTTFHQSYKNRDFISGILPSFENPGAFVITKGILYEANEFAKQEGCASLLIIDEINRGPAIEIFGGSIVSIEPDKRLQNDNTKGPNTTPFTILKPDEPNKGEYVEYALSPNLYILAAMNQADTSIMALDVAFLRRWLRFDINPDYSVLYDRYSVNPDDTIKEKPEAASDVYNVAIKALIELNRLIAISAGTEYQMGHGMLCQMKKVDELDKALNELIGIWPFIRAHLEEVYFKEYTDLGYVLNEKSTKSPCSLKLEDFNGRELEVLTYNEVDLNNIYDLFYSLAEKR